MEPLGQTIVVPVSDSSQVALARRSARSQALRVGLEASRADEVEIAAVELATNLLHHGGGGHLLLNAFVHAQTLEVMAVDSGRGMANLMACSEDGFSSASTPGLGLGSIRRLSDEMEAYSWPDKGTVIAARFRVAGESHPTLPGVVCTALQGEEVTGDRWACKQEGELKFYLVVDGLGHGLHASEAASMAVEIFLGARSGTPAALVQQMHEPMRSTRGAALAILCADPKLGSVSYCGVGNISSSLHRGGRTVNLVSQNGTVGHQARQIRAFEYPYAEGDVLVMHSDGISTHWSLDKYPELLSAGVAQIAAILHRDFNRGRDDATVLVARV
jgi:anti-sigma regulatory factor (Ser/Thr protein kinase)